MWFVEFATLAVVVPKSTVKSLFLSRSFHNVFCPYMPKLFLKIEDVLEVVLCLQTEDGNRKARPRVFLNVKHLKNA